MQTVHLTAVTPGRRASAVKAIRDGFAAAGMDREKALDAADSAVRTYLHSHKRIGLLCDEDEAVAKFIEAFNAVVDGSAEVAVAEAKPDVLVTEAEPQVEAEENPFTGRDAIRAAFKQPIPPQWEPSLEGARTALLILAASNGIPQTAWVWVQKLAVSTGDPELYLDAGRLLKDTFED